MKTFGAFLFLLLVLLMVFCTSNPFFGDSDTARDNLLIKGSVTLEEEDDHSGIFVWLRGINAKTWSETDGSFALELPNPKSLPGGAFAWNGDLPLYFYMDNYRIDSVMVYVLNGKLKPEQDNVTNKGQLRFDKQLGKIIHISSTVYPESIPPIDCVFVTVHFEIKQRGRGSTLFTYKDGDDSLKAFYIFRIDDPLGTYQKYFLPPGAPYKGYFNKTLYGTHTIKVSLPRGAYKFIPFVHLAQPGIPLEMFIEIGEYPDRFTQEYLKMPITTDSQVLTVN